MTDKALAVVKEMLTNNPICECGHARHHHGLAFVKGIEQVLCFACRDRQQAIPAAPDCREFRPVTFVVRRAEEE